MLVEGMLILLAACTPDLPFEPLVDPFVPLPDVDSPLTDVSDDLHAVLENGALAGACADYASDPSDRDKKLLCGKAMFFHEPFDATGVPTAIFDFLPTAFPALVGPAWSSFGLIADPYSNQGRPLGFPEGEPLPGGSPTVAFGCASCHFGRLPDGRYAVGMPNLDYDYGRQMVAITLSPAAITPDFDPADHHPTAIASVQPILDAFADRPALTLEFGLALLPLLNEDNTPMSVEYEGYYAGWAPGTMDFVIDPLPLEDGVHIVTRILPLWEIPTAAQAVEMNAGHAQLAWTGAAPELWDFLSGFVAVTGSDDDWPENRLEPLHDYLMTLRAPAAPLGDATAVASGRQTFFETDCADCHVGPRGGGLQVYSFDEIGSDATLAMWGDPELAGEFCCGMNGPDAAPPTHGVKAPRLTGLWTQRSMLHNGAVPSLEALLCLDPRPGVVEAPYADGGHTYGCDLPESDRRDLGAFLTSL